MDDSFDGVDRIDPYRRSDRVKPSQQSSPDRRQKFAQELKERMDDEQRRRRQQQKDEIIIDRADLPLTEDEDKQSAENVPPQGAEQETTDEGVKEEDKSSQSGEHIDLTA